MKFNQLPRSVGNYVKNRKKRKQWLTAVISMACVVAFCVTYSLILNAITMTENQTLACPYEVHQHEESCFDADGNVICGYADYAVHTHDPDCCYDSDGNLVCLLEEIQPHIHTDSCYDEQSVLICGLPEVILHTHSDACYEDIQDDNGNVVGKKLICGMLQVEEHQHDESCMVSAALDGDTQVASNVMLFSARLSGTCDGVNWLLTPAAGGGYRLVLSAGTSTAIPTALLSDATLSAYKSVISAVEIDADITEIEANAFADASELRSVTFGTDSALTTIGSGAFSGCGNLTSVNLEDCTKLAVIESGGSPETGAFSGAGLTQVTIPAGVTTMGDFAFFGCQNLSAVNFTENTAMTNMGAYVFARCISLESVNLENLKGESLTFGTKDSVTIGEIAIENGNGMFYGCTSLKSLSLPDMSGSIAYLCKGCSSLTSLSLDQCAKLVCDDTSGDAAFLHFIEDCNQLKTLDLSGVTGMTTLYTGIVQGGVKTVILPPTLTRVAQTALGWTNVEELVFTRGSDGKSSLKQIGGTNRDIPSHTQAFAAADKLMELHLELDPDAQQSELFLLTSAFLNCTNLETLSVSSPAGLEELGEGCFAGCKSLQNLTWNVKKVNTVINWSWSVGALSENIRFTVGPITEVLPGYLLSSMKDNISEYIFTPGYSFYVTGAAGGPFTEAGCYYADENGNLYRLNSDFTAELVYVNRSGSGALTVPSTLTAKTCTDSGRADADTLFTVTGVCKDAFKDSGYDSVTFTAPGNITVIEDNAFAGAYNLISINENTAEQDIKALFTNCTFGNDLFMGTKITARPFENSKAVAVYPDSDPFGVAGNLVQITADSDSKLTDIKKLNHFATGESANITVGVSNSGSEKRVRLYLKVSDPTSFTLPNYLGGAALHSTSENNVFYYDVPIPEDTAAYSLSVTCDGLTAPGKKAYVWLLEADNEDVLNSLDGAVVEPGVAYPADGTAIAAASDKYIELTWDVLPKVYSVAKTLNTDITPAVKKTAGADSASTVVNLSFIVNNITANRSYTDEKSYDSYGADFVSYVNFTDVLKLPDGLKWMDGILDAEFTPYVSGDKKGGRITATVNGNDYTLCTLNLASDSLTDLKCAAKDGNLEITWTVTNRDVTSEITSAAATLTYGPEVIMVDGAVTEATEFSITNTVTAVPCYTYSGFSEAVTAEATRSLTAEPSPLAASNDWVKKPTHMGEEAVYKITLDHLADANAAADVDIYDELGTNQYLASETIEKMLLGDGYDGDCLTVTINNAVVLPVPLSQTVTAVDGATTAQTSVKNTGKTPAYDGLAREYDYSDATITFKKDITNGGIIVTVKITGGETATYSVGTGKEYSTLQSALDDIGFVRSIWGSCVLHWHFPEGTVQTADDHKEYELHALVNNSFQMMTEDHNTSIVADVAGGSHIYPVYNKLYISAADYGSEHNAISTDVAETYYDLSIDKITEVDNVPRNTTQLAELIEERLKDGGFVIDYSLDIRHYGTGTYGLLPVVDRMTGIQALLAEVEDNAGAKWITEDIPIYTVDGKQYYVLNADGVAGDTAIYHGVWLQNGYADSVTVTKNADGLDTLIKWYYIADAKNDYTLAPAYRAICSTTYANGINTDNYHFIFNEAWLNDVPTRRLHDVIGAEGTSIAFEKHIVTEKDAIPAGDQLWSDPLSPYPISGEGTKITYRLDFIRTGVQEISLAGADFYDILPAVALNGDGSPVFEWTDANVKVSYTIVGEGVNVSDITASGYDIVREAEGSADYRIRWKDDFSINFPAGEGGEVYIYVELTFPTGVEWAQYVDSKGNTVLYNSLYVHDVDSRVCHVLPVSGEAMLRKGVYETGYYTLDSGGNTNQYFRGADRSHYVRTVENNAVKNTVTYFVTLYNSSDTANLYLSPIYDLLPEGFTFYSLVSTPISADSSMAYSGSVFLSSRGSWEGVIGDVDIVELTAYGYAPLAKPDEASLLQWNGDGGNRTVSVRSPYNTQTLVFDVVLDEGHQDALGYYLKPGEAIQFGYMCFTGDADVTEADSSCAMEYLDYSNSGVSLTAESNQTVTVDNTVFSATANTGSARLIGNARAAELGFTQTNPNNPAANRRWLTSRVSLEEGTIIPGITAKVENYNVQLGDQVVWNVTSTNTGFNALRDYTLTDAMQSPFRFTGSVNYRIRSGVANTYSMNTPDNRDVVIAGSGTDGNLFDITEVTDANVTLVSNTGETYTLLYGQEQELTVSVTSAGGAPENAKINVKFTKTDNVDSTMSIRFSDPLWSIPANGESLLTVITNVPEGTTDVNGLYVNNASITPTQSFDPNSVTQGSVSPDQKSDSSAASVNIYTGIQTTAYKEVASGEKYGVSANYATTGDTIVLENSNAPITYTLNVNGVGNNNMQKLVVIDSLPQPDDTNPVNDKLKRGSRFRVNFADNPDVSVQIVTKDSAGTVINTEMLDPAYYTVWYSDRTGNFAPDTDYQYNENEDNSELYGWDSTLDPANDRSVRVVIKRALTEYETVRISFQAVIAEPDTVTPGALAWNNFGYSFLTKTGMWLYAAPQKVGVATKSAPAIVKELVNADGTPVSAAEKTEFNFIVYKGSGVNFKSHDAASLGEALADREFTCVTVPVSQGESSGRIMTDPRTTYQYTYENGAFIKGTEHWLWENETQYTVVEIDDNGEYTHKSENAVYTFTYKEAQNQTVTVCNTRHNWSIVLTKTNNKDVTLSGAVFGLYSVNENPDIKEQFNAVGLPENTATTYTASDGKTWYLSQVGITDTDGTVKWTDLCEDRYLLLELKAPNGYIPSMEVFKLDYKNARKNVITPYTLNTTVINTAGYRLPGTGGEGVHLYMVGGFLLITASGVFLLYNRRKRGR